jgi:hypothetical protein
VREDGAAAPSLLEPPFVPFAPFSATTREHILCFMDILEFHAIYDAFAARTGTGTLTSQVSQAIAAAGSPEGAAAAAAVEDVFYFSTAAGRGARSLSKQLARIKDRYLRARAKGTLALGIAPSILQPMEHAADLFISKVIVATAAEKISSQPPPQTQAAANTAAAIAAASAASKPTIPLSRSIFASLYSRVLQRLELVLWRHYTSPENNTPEAAATAGPDNTYVAAFNATRERIIQKVSKNTAQWMQYRQHPPLERIAHTRFFLSLRVF